MKHIKRAKAAAEVVAEDRKVTEAVQGVLEDISESFSSVVSRISRVEGMEGHARACHWRLPKYFREKQWGFEIYAQKSH